jgi:hypothetical protein
MVGSVPTTRQIPYELLSEIRIGRSAVDRIDGRPTLVLASRTGNHYAIASVAQAGVIAEIAERLAALRNPSAHRDGSLAPPAGPQERP